MKEEKGKKESKKDKKEEKKKRKSKKKEQTPPNFGFPFNFPQFDRMDDEQKQDFNREFQKQLERTMKMMNDSIKKNVEEGNNPFGEAQNFQKVLEDLFKQMGFNFSNFKINPIKPEDLAKLSKKAQESGNPSPFVFGMNITIGPDGIPRFTPFSKAGANPDMDEVEPEEDLTREPLTDIIEEEDEVIVVAEIPGAVKETIKLDANEESITITATDEEGERSYNTTLDLPVPIIPDRAKASFKNGILEVRLQKSKK